MCVTTKYAKVVVIFVGIVSPQLPGFNLSRNRYVNYKVAGYFVGSNVYDVHINRYLRIDNT